MSKMTGNNRISALKRLSTPSSINERNNRSLIGSKNSSINDARQILANKTKTPFDARQLLSRQSSTNNEDMVVITGLKDMKMKDGRVNKQKTFRRKRRDLLYFLAHSNCNDWKCSSRKKEKDLCCWSIDFCYYS